MELHYLRIFDTVAKVESYKKASDILHISQPAISTEVKKLEEQVGMRLFDRTGNRIYLNANGRLMRQYTGRIFETVEELENAISDARAFVGGTLNIGASNTPASFVMPQAMAEFKRTYPPVRFNMSVGTTSEIAELMNSGRLDFAVNGGKCKYGNRISTRCLYEDHLVLVSSPMNPISELKNISPICLEKEAFIVHEPASQLYVCYEDMIRKFGLAENIAMTLGNIDAIKNAVRTNAGIALVPALSVRTEAEKGVLSILDFPAFSVAYPYHLIYSREKSMSPAALKFMEFLVHFMEKLG